MCPSCPQSRPDRRRRPVRPAAGRGRRVLPRCGSIFSSRWLGCVAAALVGPRPLAERRPDGREARVESPTAIALRGREHRLSITAYSGSPRRRRGDAAHDSASRRRGRRPAAALDGREFTERLRAMARPTAFRRPGEEHHHGAIHASIAGTPPRAIGRARRPAGSARAAAARAGGAPVLGQGAFAASEDPRDLGAQRDLALRGQQEPARLPSAPP